MPGNDTFLDTLAGYLTIRIVRYPARVSRKVSRSEEHTSELQSQSNHVCRLLLEKTTLNIAAGLAMRGRKVLIIDIDPQANASLALLGPDVLNLPTSIYDVLLEEHKPLRDILTPT